MERTTTSPEFSPTLISTRTPSARRSSSAYRLTDSCIESAAMLRAWLDRWAGLGDIVTGMNRQGFDARRSRFPFGRRAEFSCSQVNPMPKWVGQAAAREPWRAVQWAALDTLKHVEDR